MKSILKEIYKSYLKEEGGFKYNCATVPLDKAREYATMEFQRANLDIDEILPDFDENYELLQAKCSRALDIPRIEMPVIEPSDMKVFQEKLKNGHIDIFKPYVKGSEYFPKNLTPQDGGEEFITLGVMDGDKTDDRVKGKLKPIKASKMLPTQSQIWLEKIVGNTIKFGVPKGKLKGAPLIVSREGYILDGHHRFATAIIADKSITIDSLYIPLSITLLVKIGRTYGNSIGNKQKG